MKQSNKKIGKKYNTTTSASLKKDVKQMVFLLKFLIKVKIIFILISKSV